MAKKSFSELTSGQKPVLVDFSADWCGPCKMLAPILEDLKHRVGNKATIIKIDVDRNPMISQQFGIQSVPTLMIFQNGEVKWRNSGVIGASDLETLLTPFFKN